MLVHDQPARLEHATRSTTVVISCNAFTNNYKKNRLKRRNENELTDAPRFQVALVVANELVSFDN